VVDDDVAWVSGLMSNSLFRIDLASGGAVEEVK